MRKPKVISIREAAEADIPTLAEIGKACFPSSGISEEKMRARLIRGHLVFVAELDGEVAGFVDLLPLSSTIRISGIATAPSFKKKGIGTSLLNRAISYAKERGKTGIELRVAARNLKALSIYRKFGFMISGRKTALVGLVVYRMKKSFET